MTTLSIPNEIISVKLLPELGKEFPWRPPFVRDYGRIIHSASFRRLQGKTQTFLGHESDFFRNRLTHSLEVAQIAEGIVDRLNWTHPFFQDDKIDGRLCLTASLIHDLGHPPFGHNGERALDAPCASMGASRVTHKRCGLLPASKESSG